MDEKRPEEDKVNDSRSIPCDKDFDLASENGKLKERVKELEDGLLSSGKLLVKWQKIAEERIANANEKVNEPGITFSTAVFLVLGLSIFGFVMAIIMSAESEYQQRKTIEGLQGELKTDPAQEKHTYTPDVTLVRTRDGGEYISKQDFFTQLNGASRYFRDQIEKLEKEKAELTTGVEKAKAESADLRSKFDAEKAELQKKFDEISATTAAEKANQLALSEAERLAKQKKAAEELVRSWCGVPVVNAPVEANKNHQTVMSTDTSADDDALLKCAGFVLLMLSVFALCCTDEVRSVFGSLINLGRKENET